MQNEIEQAQKLLSDCIDGHGDIDKDGAEFIQMAISNYIEAIKPHTCVLTARLDKPLGRGVYAAECDICSEDKERVRVPISDDAEFIHLIHGLCESHKNMCKHIGIEISHHTWHNKVLNYLKDRGVK